METEITLIDGETMLDHVARAMQISRTKARRLILDGAVEIPVGNVVKDPYIKLYGKT